MFTWEIMFHCLRILIISWLFKDLVVIMKEIMSWLFKDPINRARLNLTMPNQTVKNGLNATKIKLPQINFFLEKQIKNFDVPFGPFYSAKF